VPYQKPVIDIIYFPPEHIQLATSGFLVKNEGIGDIMSWGDFYDP